MDEHQPVPGAADNRQPIGGSELPPTFRALAGAASGRGAGYRGVLDVPMDTLWLCSQLAIENGP